MSCLFLHLFICPFIRLFIHSFVHSVFMILLCARHSFHWGQRWQNSLCFKWWPAWPGFPLRLVYYITNTMKLLSTFQQTNNGKFFNEESWLRSGEMKNNMWKKYASSCWDNFEVKIFWEYLYWIPHGILMGDSNPNTHSVSEERWSLIHSQLYFCHFLALWLWVVFQPLWPFFLFSHQKSEGSLRPFLAPEKLHTLKN